MGWEHGEAGPPCSCGRRTTVVLDDGKPSLQCVAHTVINTRVETWPLPESKPASWPVAAHVLGHRLVGCGAGGANA